MEKIGFIGVGVMGKPMAQNLMKAKYPVTVHDLNPKPVKELVAAGAAETSSPRETAEKSDVIITMLPSSPDVEQVLLGPEGVLAGIRKGSIIIDMSTIDPMVTRKVAAAAADKGIQMLDAPVSGGSDGAVDGTLTIMVGGEKEVLEQCKDILQAMGKKIFHVGPVGMGEVVKLSNNLMCAVEGIAVCEGFLFGTKLGADPKILFEVISVSSGNCWFLQKNLPYPGVIPESRANNDFAPGFTTDLMAKDLGLALSAADAAKIPLLACSQARQLLEATRASGLNKKDWSVVTKIMQRLAEAETS